MAKDVPPEGFAPPFSDLVAALPATVPFVGPEALERATGRPFVARLGANESGFGPAPSAVAAMVEAAAQTWMYGDPEMHALKAALSEREGVSPDRIVIGEGIDGLLGVTARMFLGPGRVAVMPLGGYPTFAYHVAGVGAALHTVPYRDDATDLPATAEAARKADATAVYVANPDNPMGGFAEAAALVALRAALPPQTLLLLDEAYAEFAPEGGLAPIDDDPCVIRFRTFSKAMGLAGLRVGYAIAAPQVAAGFDRIRNHFGVGRIAQAGALAAARDVDWLAQVRAATAAARGTLIRTAADNGLTALPSATNFVAIDCGRDGAFARAVLQGLAAHGVFVRMPGVAPLDRCIRVTAGPPDAMAAFAEALPAALAQARAS
jgi:histidinol-phosphate aminotransferase